MQKVDVEIVLGCTRRSFSSRRWRLFRWKRSSRGIVFRWDLCVEVFVRALRRELSWEIDRSDCFPEIAACRISFDPIGLAWIALDRIQSAAWARQWRRQTHPPPIPRQCCSSSTITAIHSALALATSDRSAPRGDPRIDWLACPIGASFERLAWRSIGGFAWSYERTRDRVLDFDTLKNHLATSCKDMYVKEMRLGKEEASPPPLPPTLLLLHQEGVKRHHHSQSLSRLWNCLEDLKRNA